MIRAYSHFSFTVSDVDASRDWYVSELGFTEVLRQRQDNDYTRQFVGVKGAVLEVAVLEFGACRLELVQYAEPLAQGQAPNPGEVGFCHLSFVVDDIDAEFARLSQSAAFRSPPVAITAGGNVGGFVCYFTDRDGNGLELFQPAREKQR